MSETPDLDRIASYRAAAAKLGEALAKGSPPDHVAMGEALTILSLLSNQTWLTQAAQLRLLVEAELLEQKARQDRGIVAARRKQSELGARVRTWREGVNT